MVCKRYSYILLALWHSSVICKRWASCWSYKLFSLELFLAQTQLCCFPILCDLSVLFNTINSLYPAIMPSPALLGNSFLPLLEMGQSEVHPGSSFSFLEKPVRSPTLLLTFSTFTIPPFTSISINLPTSLCTSVFKYRLQAPALTLPSFKVGTKIAKRYSCMEFTGQHADQFCLNFNLYSHTYPSPYHLTWTSVLVPCSQGLCPPLS